MVQIPAGLGGGDQGVQEPSADATAAGRWGGTYTECSTTPAQTQRPDTAEAATHPATRPCVVATNRWAGSRAAAKAAQSGAQVSKVALPSSIPA